MSKCFVMMPFADTFKEVMEGAIRPAITSCNLQCVRVDENLHPIEIPEDIRTGIDESCICIADLTGLNRNVVYEVALAHAKNKPVILITQDQPETLPFDLRNFRVFTYLPTPKGIAALRNTLAESLSAVIGAPESPTRYLEEMLVPPSIKMRNEPFVLGANPCLSGRARGMRGCGFNRFRHTSSDQVGIRGVIQAFGFIFGLERLPEFLDPRDYTDDTVREHAANLYCIGSPKVNKWSGMLLDAFNRKWSPSLEFKADPASTDLLDIRVMLYLNGHPYTPPNFGNRDTDPFVRDFGVLLRGPHPFHPNSLMTIMAGRSSLGTEAVCRAATNPLHIATIKERLQRDHHIDLSDHTQAFYAIVSMDRDMTECGTYEGILPSLTIIDVQPFHRRN